jgi:hypothetical protein
LMEYLDTEKGYDDDEEEDYDEEDNDEW